MADPEAQRRFYDMDPQPLRAQTVIRAINAMRWEVAVSHYREARAHSVAWWDLASA